MMAPELPEVPSEATKARSILSRSKGNLQVAEARIAGAEIVQRDAHAERAQGLEARLRLPRIVDENAFGHFEDDTRSGDAGLGHDRADKIDEAGIADLQRREIDRHEQTGPARAIGHRLPQHEFAEPGHQPVLLGERNEQRRRNRAAHGMGPAQQRFGADDALPSAARIG